jgi:hypothetical protein
MVSDVQVMLLSNTSNNLYGEVSCRRADVTVTIPSACLLDESKLEIRVQKGHIRTGGDLTAANFDTITLSNDIGEILAHNLQVCTAPQRTYTDDSVAAGSRRWV